MIETEFKKCKGCCQKKPATTEYFHKNKKGEYGLHSKCKKCKNNKDSKRQKENLPEILEKHKQYRKNNDNYRIAGNLRRLVHKAVHEDCQWAISKAEDLLGCTIKHYKQHVESKFEEGMSWKNYSEWERDHTVACLAKNDKGEYIFDLTNTEDQKTCFYWTNWQPLWKSQNRSKGNR